MHFGTGFALLILVSFMSGTVAHDKCHNEKHSISKRKISDGQWSQWSAWGTCSKTCGNGTKIRTRICRGAVDQSCLGLTKEEKPCNQKACPGQWSEWSQWSTCVNKEQFRTRICQNGTGCPGKAKETQRCRLGEWQAWSSCTVSCGTGGQQTRTRTCPANDCPSLGVTTEKRPCSPQPAPCAKWNEWSVWTTCSRTCGGGDQSRNRTCLPIDDSNFGQAKLTAASSCVGQNRETKKCNAVPCPVQKWSDWTVWSLCSVTCGVGGRQTRKRTCVGGTTCAGPKEENQLCGGPKPCDKGAWGDWQQWSQCTKTCAGGEQTRQRVCINGKPGSVTGCNGSAIEKRQCNKQNCPTWSEWNWAGPCSVTCGNGTRRRTRNCIGGNKCAGSTDETVTCTNKPCKN